MSDPTRANETPVPSTDDRRKPETDTAATGPKDTVTGTIRETPDAPSDRPGTEAEEARR